MDNKVFWKNFSLGRELSVAGSFIYDGLENFDELKTLDNEDEIFGFLYNIAVGIERLEKIAIIFIEHDKFKGTQKKFEKSLTTHNHSSLLKRIEKVHSLSLENPHRSFLDLLRDFYKTRRYGRYSLDRLNDHFKEAEIFKKYISKKLGIKFEEKSSLLSILNTDEIKKGIGSIIGKIAIELYKVIKAEADKLNLYTGELRDGSKAYKVFMGKQFNFLEENILWKELLIFLMNTKEENGAIDFIRGIEPLDFDLELISDYLECFQNNISKQEIIEELESLYEKIGESKAERSNLLELMGNRLVSWDVNGEEE